jgi:hypothetical protein
MSMALQSYWKQVITDYNETHEDTITTLDNFNVVLQAFFAGHATEDDQHDLLESLCLAIKPEMMKVQTFFYRIKELNDYVEWLPGQEEKLSESQLNLAFYNRLPGSWQAKYMITGQSVHTDNQSELLCYFRVQEHQQGIIDSKNQALWAKSQAKLECGQEILSRCTAQRAKAAEKMQSKCAGAKHQHGEPGSSKTKISVRPEDLCPIHLMASHTWSKCYSNASRYKDAKKSTSATNKVQKKKEKVLEANAANIALAAECVINNDESFMSDSELMAEVCCFKQLDTDLMDATATDSTVTGMSAFNQSVTHHLNELTLNAFQHEVATNILSTEFIDVFTQYCDDSYSSGVSDLNLKDCSEILLKLRSTSLATVGIIQQNKTNALWKVLFDSGSDKTIVKRMSLPSGIETLTGKKHKILGVNASSTADQDMLLKDITIPEFSSSQ